MSEQRKIYMYLNNREFDTKRRIMYGSGLCDPDYIAASKEFSYLSYIKSEKELTLLRMKYSEAELDPTQLNCLEEGRVIWEDEYLASKEKVDDQS